jgi:hypothetical protein
MKNFLFFLCSLSLVACRDFNSNTTNEFSSHKQVKLAPPVTSVESIESPTIKDFYGQEGTFLYTVVLDTSSNEQLLRDKMFNLHNKLKIPFVRVIKDRTGNSSRDKYILEDGLSPKNLFNEFGSGINMALTWSNSWVNFSLINTDSFIYMSLRDHTINCDDSPSYKWYTLIGGVFESKKNADSALRIYKKEESHAYLQIEPGCIYITSAPMSE